MRACIQHRRVIHSCPDQYSYCARTLMKSASYRKRDYYINGSLRQNLMNKLSKNLINSVYISLFRTFKEKIL